MNSIESIILALIEKEAKRIYDSTSSDEPDKGEWLGKSTLVKYAGKKQLYRYTPDINDPMRFAHVSGYEFMAGACDTDTGSIPWIAQQIPVGVARLKPIDFWQAYVHHDYACEYGFLYVRNGPVGPWHEIQMSLKQADVALKWFLSAKTIDGKSATIRECELIYMSVRSFHAAQGK